MAALPCGGAADLSDGEEVRRRQAFPSNILHAVVSEWRLGFSHVQSCPGDPGVSELPAALSQQGRLQVDPDCGRRGGGHRLVREVQHQEGRQPPGELLHVVFYGWLNSY